jgi:hypothetical protein
VLLAGEGVPDLHGHGDGPLFTGTRGAFPRANVSRQLKTPIPCQRPILLKERCAWPFGQAHREKKEGERGG